MAATVESDTTQHLTIHYAERDDGWVTATIEEEPAAISQGRSREEAYTNVLEALHDLRHQATPVERLALAFEARVLEPLVELVRQRRRQLQR